jgi:hypothetical protein
MSDNPPPESPPPAEAGTPTTATNISGGVNLDAQRDVNIGGDVVGRDKISVQTANINPLFNAMMTAVLVFLIIAWLMTFTCPVIPTPPGAPVRDFGYLFRRMFICCSPIPIVALIASIILSSRRNIILSVILIVIIGGAYVFPAYVAK